VNEAIVVTAEFRLKPGTVGTWLRIMLDRYGPACVAERGMLRYWLHQDDTDPEHILLYEQWADRADFDASMHADWRAAYHADTEHLWAADRVVTTYHRIETTWERLDVTGLPTSLTPRASLPNGR
jgi:quinol monooxygenase YgiN